MAEKFVKPKRFTKEWWGYFWDYYKVHFWVVVFIIIAVVITVKQTMSQPKYLMNVTYAGEGAVLNESMESMLYDISRDLTQEENDGISFSQLNFDYSDTADIQYTVAMEQKLQLEFFVNETMLYLLDEAKLSQVTTAENYENIWLPISEWAENMPDEALIKHEYGVSLENSRILKEYGINGNKIYLAVRKCYDEDDEKAMKRYEYSKEVAKILIEE